MKLSMWMIANRLSALDCELQIQENAPICLNSARRAYATNCVHVYQEGTHSVCAGEGGKIILKDMSSQQAFEIVQSIFDFYSEWYSKIQAAVNLADFQQILDESWLIFHNPLILLGADCKVLALSSQYTEDEINSEWAHLCRYGYSSVNCIRYFKSSYAANDYYVKNKAQLFTTGREIEESVSMSIAIYHQNDYCGRLNIVQHSRELNYGDRQLLNFLAPFLAYSMAALQNQQKDISVHNIFISLIHDDIYDSDLINQRLQWQMQYMKWNARDTFQVATLHSAEEIKHLDVLVLISNLVRKQIPQAYVFLADTVVTIIYDLKIIKKTAINEKLKDILARNRLFMGVSLPFQNMENLKYFFRQSIAAAEYGLLYHPGRLIKDFYDYALYYLLEASSIDDLLCACHPDIRRLHESDLKDDSDKLKTLSTFLNNERSFSHTAKELFIHRNTLVYRINKIMQLFTYDFEDIYCRDYMKTTIRIMDLFQKKYQPKQLPAQADS